jgi:tetrapyrrole methylase family protein/MazG family protein/ATP diphosphatase
MAPQSRTSDHPIFRLIEVMARLRDKDGGCPWDLEQTFASIAPYTIEEAYEVADAIDRGDPIDLKEELGDLLLQVVYHAQMAAETGAFDFADVAGAITDKMIRRHPHVFGEMVMRTAAQQTTAWETAKASERAAKPASSGGLLDGVAVALPALTRALKLSKRAARVGFVWPSVDEVLRKLEEEIAELKAELAAGDLAKAREELGDMLFVCANIARELEVDPEAALRRANAKFVRRFEFIEARLREASSSPAESTLAEMETLWQAAKTAERVGVTGVANGSAFEDRSGVGSASRLPDDRR